MITTAKDFYRMLNKYSRTPKFVRCYIFDFIRNYMCICARTCVLYIAQLIWFHLALPWSSFAKLGLLPVNAFRIQPQFDRYRRTITNVTWLTPTAIVLSRRYIGLAVPIIVKTYGQPCELMTSNLTNYQSYLHRCGWSHKINTAERPYQPRSAK